MARRSPKDWAIRLSLSLVATVFGLYGTAFSLAQVLATGSPALAHRLAPYDGRITATYASTLAGEDATAEDRSRADQLARLALRQDPTAVAALATLGLNADLRGDEAAARRSFSSAQKLSRRDLRTQLWMIEDAVGRGDVPDTLRQYDVTLRVFPSLGDIVFPVLASAVSEPTIRQELVRTLAAKPAWGDGFLIFMATQGPDSQASAALLIELRHAGVGVPEPVRAAAVNSLIRVGQTDAAWAYYAAQQPGADRRHSRDPRFTEMPKAPSLLDWVVLNESGSAASIENGVFDFSAPASVGGPMLQQLQLLPPGRYRLVGHSSGVEQTEDSRPFWSLKCQDGRELGRIDVSNSTVAGGVFSGQFTVPAGCPAQMLVLASRPSDAVSGTSGQFDRVELAPVE